MKKLLLIVLFGSAVKLSAICGYNVYSEAATAYQKCTSCHGILGEKSALNKSQVIQTWSKQKIYKALKGYQEETYGGEHKAIMQEQLSTLKTKDLRLIVNYIGTVRTWAGMP